MKVNIQKPMRVNRPPLPEPPFCVRLSSRDDWYQLLKDYPELEEKWRWGAGQRLSQRNYDNLYRMFYADFEVYYQKYEPGHVNLVEYPG